MERAQAPLLSILQKRISSVEAAEPDRKVSNRRGRGLASISFSPPHSRAAPNCLLRLSAEPHGILRLPNLTPMA
jgi:hypothetical protein